MAQKKSEQLSNTDNNARCDHECLLEWPRVARGLQPARGLLLVSRRCRFWAKALCRGTPEIARAEGGP